MELNAWIDSKARGQAGVNEVADLLRENPRTVLSWYRQERAPCLRAAMNIVQTSHGEVDYNGIYEPIAKRLQRFKRLGG
ncbi:hypothetical protein ACF8GD_00370 [Pseudomonas putida]|uniref:hypothetical protein n=1 Tax=Pseudomonas putida TaxID=303 RepID=UPI00370A7B28